MLPALQRVCRQILRHKDKLVTKFPHLSHLRPCLQDLSALTASMPAQLAITPREAGRVRDGTIAQPGTSQLADIESMPSKPFDVKQEFSVVTGLKRGQRRRTKTYLVGDAYTPKQLQTPVAQTPAAEPALPQPQAVPASKQGTQLSPQMPPVSSAAANSQSKAEAQPCTSETPPQQQHHSENCFKKLATSVLHMVGFMTRPDAESPVVAKPNRRQFRHGQKHTAAQGEANQPLQTCPPSGAADKAAEPALSGQHSSKHSDRKHDPQSKPPQSDCRALPASTGSSASQHSQHHMPSGYGRLPPASSLADNRQQHSYSQHSKQSTAAGPPAVTSSIPAVAQPSMPKSYSQVTAQASDETMQWQTHHSRLHATHSSPRQSLQLHSQSWPKLSSQPQTQPQPQPRPISQPQLQPTSQPQPQLTSQVKPQSQLPLQPQLRQSGCNEPNQVVSGPASLLDRSSTTARCRLHHEQDGRDLLGKDDPTGEARPKLTRTLFDTV